MFAVSLQSSRPGLRSIARLAAALGMAAYLLLPTNLSAQGAKAKKGNEAEKITGKVTEVERKGKAATLTIEKEGGGTLEVPVTPRLALSVTGRGDASCLSTRTWVSSEKLALANNELFGSRFTIHIGKAPAPQCGPDPAATDVFMISGQIVGIAPDGMTVNCGEAGNRRVMFEQGVPLDITINSTDADLIGEGARIEMEGMTRGGKFVPAKVTVNLDKSLTGEDLHPGSDKKAAAKAKQAATAKGAPKKAAKGTKADEGAGEPIDAGSDPFGVLGNSDSKADAKGAAKSPPDKKSPEKKAPAKPPEKK
jgi:hypothetical protein